MLRAGPVTSAALDELECRRTGELPLQARAHRSDPSAAPDSRQILDAAVTRSTVPCQGCLSQRDRGTRACPHCGHIPSFC